MNLVDSCGWLEYYADGPNADFYAGAIEDIDNLIVPVICIYEVFRKILQQRGEAPALQAVALMHQGLIVDLSSPLALSAAKIGVELKMPLADSIILATARVHNATVWTQDAHFKDIEGIRYVGKT
ncbi:MAG: type II toxin-antitoxin system VapC family toxin [Syntrophorhabdus sp.]|nr:type II toxin-antitoxin system VapC family toxin [Syntrophorhabdus sp.]